MVAVKRAFEKADVTMPEPIYRLRVENVDLNDTRSASKAGSIDQTMLPLEETQADTAIEEQVEQHRSGDDLLSSAAPRE
jgi:hypothetical protein